jgi:SAM-dependent methyltransferase
MLSYKKDIQISIQSSVEDYYTKKINSYGPHPKGVDWNCEATQNLRFRQLSKIIDMSNNFSINDFGCGYGALLNYLKSHYSKFNYCGLDISAPMILAAKGLHNQFENHRFNLGSLLNEPSDYTIASGVFNVRLTTPIIEWKEYVLSILNHMSSSSIKGFAFNFLTSYSDPHLMRNDLFYADPCFYFDYCKKNYSKNIALLHDYGLHEFTILVKKD